MDNEDVFVKMGKKFCMHTPDAEFRSSNNSGCYYENMSTKAIIFHAWTDTDRVAMGNECSDMHNGD